MTLHPQFVTDSKGNKQAVLLPIKEYEKLLEQLEDAEDLKLYDQAKGSNDVERIDFDEYLKSRKAK